MAHSLGRMRNSLQVHVSPSAKGRDAVRAMPRLASGRPSRVGAAGMAARDGRAHTDMISGAGFRVNVKKVKP